MRTWNDFSEGREMLFDGEKVKVYNAVSPKHDDDRVLLHKWIELLGGYDANATLIVSIHDERMDLYPNDKVHISDLSPHTSVELDLGDFRQSLNRETIIECLSKMLYFDNKYEDGDGLYINEPNEGCNYIQGKYIYEDIKERVQTVFFMLIKGKAGMYFYTFFDGENTLYILN